MHRYFFCALLIICPTLALAQSSLPSDIIESIEPSITRPNRDGHGITWFHPRGGVMATAQGPVVFLTMQQVTGSDYYGPSHWSVSKDFAKTWSEPQPIPGVGRVPLRDGIE